MPTDKEIFSDKKLLNLKIITDAAKAAGLRPVEVEKLPRPKS